MKIAFLGAGLMGSGFIRKLLAEGHEVSVWNRSAAKAKALEAHGAKAFANAADAVRGAERVQLSLSDDASVDAALEPLAGVIDRQAWIIDHTTTATTPTRERAERWLERGFRFVHAPVFMGPANAQEGTGLILLSGSKSLCDLVTPMLEPMCTKLVYLGEQPERAASFKLFGNLVLMGVAGVLGDVSRLAAATGVRADDAMALFQHFNPGAMLPARAARIANGPYDQATFEVAMARKDVRLMIEEAERGGVPLAVMPAVAAVFDESIARGEGGMDVTAGVRYPHS
ncbi:MAG: NAD(P)-dependent oxidoreductase [Quisquiliibacterium sp.]